MRCKIIGFNKNGYFCSVREASEGQSCGTTSRNIDDESGA